MVYKMNESIIVIQAEATSPNRTNVVFWSHDRGTAKLRMKLVRKDGIPQGLPEGTTVPIRLMFKSATAEGGYGKHDYLATVEDPVNGIVSIVLEDNILGYVGTVEGSVYIDFPNDRSLDTAGRFTFSIKRSPIDDSTPELEDYYFNGFSQTIDKIEKILADGKQEIEQKIAESETQIDVKVKDTNDKITKANQDVATLNTNIDKANDRIDQANQEIDKVLSGANEFRTDIDTLKINKADKAFVDAQLAQVAKNYLTQPDYVDEINKLSSIKKMNVRLGNPANKAFNVNIELTPDKILTYEFAKNANDDYILALGGYVGTANRSTKISDMVNATEMVGVIEKTYAPNYIVNEVGTYITANFVGKKITFYHYCENRSGVWEFILDEGTGSERKVTKSAYSDVAMYKETVLFDELEKKNHTIKATFKGADPQNPPSSGNARCYFYYGGTRPQDTFRTFNVYDDVFEGQKDDELLYSYSNKDFAFEIRPSGSEEAYNFVPEHNALGSAFKVSDPKILVDGEEVTMWRDDSFLLDVGTVQLVQHVKGYHLSNLSDPLMEIITYHTIKNGVLDIKGKVKFLRATEVKNGYGMMFPYWASFGDVIKTSTGNLYEIKKSGYQIENWQETDDVKSIAVLNTSGKSNLALAITYDEFNRTMRKGESGRGNPFSWIEHRSAVMGKIYHKQFQDVVIQEGYEYRFGGRFAVSYVNDIGLFIG
ncbi:BppU family phage baseplate upper protein [Enterococcus faecium]|uniref:BppU family phage baseplate upper protein n=1 Tax=Enterococcus faecium TaxID=1352 RepID=UPI00288ECA70|nr:BppU family phage baseplate upper protein [Enterococcus faecium]MDT2300797.1 BppU family phage baseplate upper protein [Enterococcus faecium]